MDINDMSEEAQYAWVAEFKKNHAKEISKLMQGDLSLPSK